MFGWFLVCAASNARRLRAHVAALGVHTLVVDAIDGHVGAGSRSLQDLKYYTKEISHTAHTSVAYATYILSLSVVAEKT